MRLADLITMSPNVILMLPRFGISMGFGEATVDEICRKNKVSTEFFLLVCNVYSFDDYVPTIQEIEQTDLSQLLSYLTASHRYYQESRLPHIETHLQHLADQAGRFGSVLLKFYADYKADLHKHFMYEEQVAFPYIKSRCDGAGGSSYKIADYARSHSNVEDKLNDLIQIIFKYLPAMMMIDETIEMVFDILQFSADLNKHSVIEDKILIPYVALVEERQKKVSK